MLSQKKQLHLKVFLLLALVLGGCFLIFGESWANNGEIENSVGVFKKETGWWGFLQNAFFQGVLGILYAVFQFFWLFLAGAMWLLDVVISPEMFEKVFFSPVAINGINTAWGFVRDFFNLFFILIIVLIGLSVILGVGKFKDKTILIRVAGAAMLINFSKPITLFFIDMSQVFMAFFARSLGDSFSTNFLQVVNFAALIEESSLTDNIVYVVTILFVIVMTIIMAVMLFYLAVSLVIRLIAFWVLIVLSPFAFFGFAMEGTPLGDIKGNWTKDLIGWCLYGPMMLFFVWLALILVSTIGETVKFLGSSAFDPQSMDASGKGLGAFIVRLCGMLIPYITAIYLLFYGYDKAKTASSGMAKKILEAGDKKLSSWGDKAKKGGLAVGRAATLHGQRQAIKEGVKYGVQDYDGPGKWITRRLTKEGREDLQAKRVAIAKENVGGDEGAALRDYNQGKAQEKLKKWKDTPPSAEELKKAFEGKDETDKMAAILYKSQNNKLGINKEGENEYETAMKALEGHKNLQDKITQETKKENLGAFIKYEQMRIAKEKKKEGDAFFKNIDPEKDREAFLKAIRESGIQKKVFDEHLGGNLNEVFKKQNKSLYKEDGVVNYLYQKHGKKDVAVRRKFAENIKNSEVEEFLQGSEKGQHLLGIKEKRPVSNSGEDLTKRLYATNQEKINQTQI